MRHKLIKGKKGKYPSRLVELCPNCNGHMKPYYNKETQDKGKQCNKCGFLFLFYAKYKETDFITYGA